MVFELNSLIEDETYMLLDEDLDGYYISDNFNTIFKLSREISIPSHMRYKFIFIIYKSTDGDFTKASMKQIMKIDKDEIYYVDSGPTYFYDDIKNICCKYRWLNPDLKYFKCPHCGGTPNICTKNHKEVINYAVRCTLGCFNQTPLYSKVKDAIEAWIQHDTFIPKMFESIDVEKHIVKSSDLSEVYLLLQENDLSKEISENLLKSICNILLNKPLVIHN